MGRKVTEREDGFFNVEGLPEDQYFKEPDAERVAKQLDAADEAKAKEEEARDAERAARRK